MLKKSVLILLRTPPYGNLKPREALDVALTCAIFEMPVSLLFMGEGVLQLLEQQKPQLLQQKNQQALLSALPMYDIEQVYVSQQALQTYAINQLQLDLNTEAVTAAQITELIKSHDVVLSF